MAGNKIIIETSPKFSNLVQGRFEGKTDSGVETIALDVYCEGNHSETVYLKKEDGGGFQSVLIRPCEAKIEVKSRPSYEVTMNGLPLKEPALGQEFTSSAEVGLTLESKFKQLIKKIGPDISAVIDPKHRAVAEELFLKFDLLHTGEVLSQVYSGEIINAKPPAEGIEKLVLVFLDIHWIEPVQSNLVSAIEKFNGRGVDLLGVEGHPHDARLYYDDSEECSETFEELQNDGEPFSAGQYIACKLGVRMFVFGTENPKWLNDAKQKKKKMEDDFSFWNTIWNPKEEECKQVKAMIAFMEEAVKTARIRGEYIADYLLRVMNHRREKVAGLIIGYRHQKDVEAVMEKNGVGYVVFAVPGLLTESRFDQTKSLELLKGLKCPE